MARSMQRRQPLGLPYLTEIIYENSQSSAETLISTLSRLEDDACLLYTETIEPLHIPLLRLFFSAYLFALLLDEDLEEARFLTHRMPSKLLAIDDVIGRARDVLQARWARQHRMVYQLLTQPGWPAPLQRLIRRYLDHFRHTNFQLLSRVYTSIPVSLVADYLGLVPSLTSHSSPHNNVPTNFNLSSSISKPLSRDEENHIVAQLVRNGWEWDPQRRLLLPKQTTAIFSPIFEHPSSRHRKGAGVGVGEGEVDQQQQHQGEGRDPIHSATSTTSSTTSALAAVAIHVKDKDVVSTTATTSMDLRPDHHGITDSIDEGGEQSRNIEQVVGIVSLLAE